MRPQMFDTMFWPFALKAQAERMNLLHLDRDDKTAESILHGVPLEDIPVKNFHPLFCPVYVLDHRLNNAGGAGPPKWDPCSRIGVYCGHSTEWYHRIGLSYTNTHQSLLLTKNTSLRMIGYRQKLLIWETLPTTLRRIPVTWILAEAMATSSSRSRRLRKEIRPLGPRSLRLMILSLIRSMFVTRRTTSTQPLLLRPEMPTPRKT